MYELYIPSDRYSHDIKVWFCHYGLGLWDNWRVTCVLLSVFLHSCSNDDVDFIIQKEMELLDSSEQKMAIINKKLDIDYKEIKERIEEMNMDIMKMRMSEKEIPLKMARNMERYVTIQKAYKNFYEPFKKATIEAEDLNGQILALRQSVLKQEYGKEKFKEFELAKDKLQELLKSNPEERLVLPSKYNLYKIYQLLGLNGEAEIAKNDGYVKMNKASLKEWGAM